MPKISIHPEKIEYTVGEAVEGMVEVHSDGNFSFTEMYVDFICREHTQVTVGSGDDEETYYEDFFHHTERMVVMEPGEFNQGSLRVPFKFSIPNDLPTSYDGVSGDIEYKLEAKIGRKWRLDPRDRVVLIVSGKADIPDPQMVRQALVDDERILLDIEIEENEIFLGEDFIINFRIDPQMKMNGIRFDLNARELSVARGYKDTSRKTMYSVFTKKDELQSMGWHKIRIPTHKDMLATYRGPLITISVILKVVIEIPWRLDKDLTLEIFTIRPLIGADFARN